MPQQASCLPDDPACEGFEAWMARNQARYDQLNAEIAAFQADVESRRVKNWSWLDIETIRSAPRVTSSAPARILAGGNAQLDGHVVNDKSQILVGGTLSNSAAAVASAVDNRDAQAEALVEARGTAVHTYSCGGGKRCYLPTDYHSERRESVSLAVSEVRTGTAVAGSGMQLDARGKVAVGQVAGQPGTAQGTRANGVIEVISQAGQPGGPQAVVRTTLPELTLPVASLFHQHPAPTARYLVETDPRFTNQRQWLSSDYLLQALALEPR